jgi:hypothetical protein
MALRSYRHHRFPPPNIQHAIWLYLRFTLSYVEDLLTERGFRVEAAAQWARHRCSDVGPDQPLPSFRSFARSVTKPAQGTVSCPSPIALNEPSLRQSPTPLKS